MSLFLKYNLRAFAWGGFIIAITVIPGTVLPRVPVFLDLFKPDKLVHVMVFGVYTYLQARGFSRQPVYGFIRTHAAVLSIAGALLLALVTEMAQQYLIPMRNGSVVDFLANLAGCLAGLAVLRMFRRRRTPHGDAESQDR